MERGLKLFPSSSSVRHRRRRMIFAAIYAVLVAALVWPIYPLASGIRPLIFGLPLSLAYIVLVLLAMFALQIWLFLGEEERPQPKAAAKAAAASKTQGERKAAPAGSRKGRR